MKKCGRCQDTKALDQFYRKGKGHQAMCIDCTKLYHKSHYQENKQSYYDSRTKHRNGLKDWLKKLKADPCVDCGGTFHPAAMHFHHSDPSQKEKGVARLAQQSRRLALLEIAKCELICANCHAVRTWGVT